MDGRSIFVSILQTATGSVFSNEHRPLNPSSLAKDIAHAVSLVQPSHIAIDPAKLDAVNLAFEQLGLKAASRPTVFTVLRRSGNLKLVCCVQPLRLVQNTWVD